MSGCMEGARFSSTSMDKDPSGQQLCSRPRRSRDTLVHCCILHPAKRPVILTLLLELTKSDK
eukprot:3577333-Pleurochrysis_carterae.AAC.1